MLAQDYIQGDTQGVSFEAAKLFIRQKQTVDFSVAVRELSKLNALANIHCAYQQLFPEDHKTKLKDFPRSLLEARANPETLDDKVVEQLGNLFPMEDEVFLEDYAYIGIQPQNISMSWDEFGELLENPDEFNRSDDLAFPIMIWSIGNEVDRDTWDTLAENLGWNARWPEQLISHEVYIDVEALRKNLDAAGLGVFMASILMAWKDTGNIFLDFDPYNDEENYPCFTVESIVELYHLWEEARPYLEQDAAAMALWNQQPDILQTVVDIMERCSKPRDKND